MLPEKSGNITRMTSKLGQRIVIFDGDVFTFDCQHTAFLEKRPSRRLMVSTVRPR